MMKVNFLTRSHNFTTAKWWLPPSYYQSQLLKSFPSQVSNRWPLVLISSCSCWQPAWSHNQTPPPPASLWCCTSLPRAESTRHQTFLNNYVWPERGGEHRRGGWRQVRAQRLSSQLQVCREQPWMWSDESSHLCPSF